MNLVRFVSHFVGLPEADETTAPKAEILAELGSKEFSDKLAAAVGTAVRTAIESHLEAGRSVPIIEDGVRKVLEPSELER